MKKYGIYANILAMNKFSFLYSVDDIMRGVAERARLRRREQKLSQAELARRSGVSLGSLKRFEQSGEVSLVSLVKIAFALGYELDFNELFAKKRYASIEEVINERKKQGLRR